MTRTTIDHDEALAFEIAYISHQIQPLLKNRPSNVQAGVLADLMSIWLAGHWPPAAREVLLLDWLTLVRDIMPETERELFGPQGHPAGRE